MNCQWTKQVQAYHDHQLSAEDQQAMQSHLAGCGPCQAQLQALQGLSAMFASATMAAPADGFASRMRQAVLSGNGAWDQGVGRLAGWLTAVAAVVLVAVQFAVPLLENSSAGTTTNSDTNVRLAAWEVAATTPPALASEGGNGELTRMAQWFAADLAVASASQNQ